MLRVLFDFVVDTWPNPLGAGIPDSRPFGSAQGWLIAKNAKGVGTLCVGDAPKIKSLGQPNVYTLPVGTAPARSYFTMMTPFGVTVLSVTLNAAGIVPPGKQSFCTAQRYRKYHQREGIDQIMLEERLIQICASGNVQIRPFLLFDFGDFFRNISA
jgi:hypothetical protein